jgi:hypothetical protein
MEKCLEITIPWSDLGLHAGESLYWVALAHMNDHQIIPLVSQAIALEVPHDWQKG